MDAKLTKKLWKKYPNLYQDYNKPLTESLVSFGFECEDGWYDLINWLSSKLEPLCLAENMKLSKKKLKQGYGFRATQVKEKYGTLRFYMSFETPEMDFWIDQAEIESEYTCEICGKKGVLRSGLPWIRVLCTKHFITHLKNYTFRGKARIIWEETCSRLSSIWHLLLSFFR